MSARTTEAESLLTPAEVATMFRVDPKTVTRWAKAGKLTSIRTLGGHRRYRETEVRALLAGIPSSGWSDAGLAAVVVGQAGRCGRRRAAGRLTAGLATHPGPRQGRSSEPAGKSGPAARGDWQRTGVSERALSRGSARTQVTVKA